MPYDPNNPDTQLINGQLYVWQPEAPPDPTNQQSIYGGVPDDGDTSPGSGRGSWVPATYSHPSGLSLLKAIGLMAAAGAAGGGLMSGIGALAGGGGAAAGAAGAALPAAAAGVPAGIGGATLAGGSALLPAAIGGGAALGGGAAIGAAALPAAAAGVPAGIGGAVAPASVGLGGGAASAAGGAGMLSTIDKYAQLAGDVSSIIGKQEAAKSAGKVTQADLQQRQDQNALARYIAMQNAQNTAANTDLQRKQFESGNRSTTAKQALIGALLGNGITPTSFSGGHASGGLLRSLNGNPEALAAMRTLGSQGSAAQNTPLQFQGGTMVQPPAMSNLPNVDNGGFLATLARIGELAGAASPYLKKTGTSGGRGQYDASGQYLGE